jgi:hypothetical protein
VTAADNEDAAVARPPRLTRVWRRATDGPAVLGAQRPVRRGPWHARGREDSKEPWAWARGERRDLGRRAASGGAASGADADEGGARGVRDVAARQRSGRICFAEHLFE